MLQIPVVYGEWVMRDCRWHFQADYVKGGSMFTLTDASTHRQLVEMAQEDYRLDKKTELIELSYSLPDSMLRAIDTDSPTPPIRVSNDRQVRSLVELCKVHSIRLCISSTVGMTSGVNDKAYVEDKVLGEDCDGRDDEDFEEDEKELQDENSEMSDCCGGGCGNGNDDDGDGAVNTNDDAGVGNAFDDDGVAEDYSLYGKVKDEDGSDNEDGNTFLGEKGSFVGEGHERKRAWTDGIYVGASFPTKDALISQLRLTAILGKFSYKVWKSTTILFVATCRVGGCNWRVRAIVKHEPNRFWVTRYKKDHDCAPLDRIALRKRYAAKYIGRLFYDEWKTVDGATPKQLRSSLHNKYGLKMNYTTSYRALMYATELERGTPEDGYEQLPSYLYRAQQANPGTVTDLVVDDLNRFKYLFIAFGASISGFRYVRRVMVVDGCHLPGKYGGVLLVACGQDANFQIFPLAFAVVDAENNESWLWFFTKLAGCVSDQYSLAIVSDRHPSIENAIKAAMPWATRGICYYHLQDNIVAKFKGRYLLYLVKSAAYSYTLYDFNRYMDLLRETNPAVASYMEEADVKLWARVHFPGNRYNIQTSNIAESINAALKPARGFPIAYLIEYIREKLGRWFYKRREDASTLKTRHSRGVEYLLTIRQDYAEKMTVERISGWQFHVKGGHRDCIVDFQRATCQCGVYDVEKIPCSHAIAAAPGIKMDYASLVCPSYTKDCLYHTYASNIYPPVTDVEVPEMTKVLPPEVRRKAGRQKKSRWLKWLEISKKYKDKLRKVQEQ